VHLLLKAGAGQVLVWDREGILAPGDPGLNDAKRDLAQRTNPAGVTGDDIATMAEGSIVFALANPVPEVDPVAASEHAAVVASGRSDLPNQINNVLAFPGVFRGLLDAASHSISIGMLIAAARALADVVTPDELNAAYIVPSVFHPDVSSAVAAAVSKAVRDTGTSAAPDLAAAST